MKLNNKKNVFIVIPCYMFPSIYGGPITSVKNIIDNLSDDFNFFILSMDRDWDSDEKVQGIKEGWNDVGEAKVKYLKKGDDRWLGYYKMLKKVVNEANIDLVYSNGMFYAEMILPLLVQHKFGELKRIPLLTATRGDIMIGTLKIKPLKKKVYLWLIRNLKLLSKTWWQATSDEERQCQMKFLNVNSDRIKLVQNIPTQNKAINAIIKPVDNLKIVFLSRINKKKNLDLAINMVKKLKGNISLDIYGAIEHKKVWLQCEKLLEDLPDNIKIKYCGSLNQSEVIDTLSKYHVFLLPTESENYGHVIAEAITAGCIPVISDRTPWNSLNEANAGFTLPLGNEDLFVEILQMLSGLSQYEYNRYVENLNIYKKNYVNSEYVANETKDLFNYVLEMN